MEEEEESGCSGCGEEGFVVFWEKKSRNRMVVLNNVIVKITLPFITFISLSSSMPFIPLHVYYNIATLI